VAGVLKGDDGGSYSVGERMNAFKWHQWVGSGSDTNRRFLPELPFTVENPDGKGLVPNVIERVVCIFNVLAHPIQALGPAGLGYETPTD